ncbi:MAG: hypothetical protein HUU46_07400 [Candidatus Hydrogenedentes bacterium]|nr:hypothetical protein [Candidatus Hydrogenedentota bacterium]
MPKEQYRTDAPTGASRYERRDPDYAGMSLLALLMAITWLGDRDALSELIHYRTIFQFGTQRSLLLLDFISRLVGDRMDHARNRTTELWERAHDSTVMKFTSTVAFCETEESKKGKKEEADEEDADVESRPKWRVDCRLYYRALLNEILCENAVTNARSALETELAAARAFQKFVLRQLNFAYLEACRKADPFVSRYTWHIDGRGSLTVRLPKYLHGKDRKPWLERNVDDPDPQRPGERDRIQAIIREKLPIPRFCSMEKNAYTTVRSQLPGADDKLEKAMRPNMVDCVAKKTAESLDRQRNAIRKLGNQDLEALVKALLENALSGERTLESIAAEFGVSKATLSRFFGRDWSKGDKGVDTKVPDLVRIVAAIVSSDEVFMEVAAEAGVLGAAREIVNGGEPLRLKEHNDE